MYVSPATYRLPCISKSQPTSTRLLTIGAEAEQVSSHIYARARARSRTTREPRAYRTCAEQRQRRWQQETGGVAEMTSAGGATVAAVVVLAALAALAAAGTGRARGADEERGNRTAGRREVTYDGRALILDGARRMLFSGDMHYPRSTPEVPVNLCCRRPVDATCSCV